MTLKCQACGADGAGGAVYPYPDDGICTDGPIEKLMAVEAQPTDAADGYRICIMCHECWHKLSAAGGIDMWISQACWESLDPVTPFAALPRTQYRRADGTVLGTAYEPGAYTIWDPKHYPGEKS